jgi:PHD/YefM family antitoxin component YafN of YafNO toxin-antitoxin module
MLTKMTARQARDNFTDLLGAVYYGREQVAVEKKGRIFAVVMNPDEYQAVKKSAKKSFFDLAAGLQKRNKLKWKRLV